MNVDELKKIVDEYETRPNKDLIKVLDHINEEFEVTKKNLIKMTYYLDNLELTYNKLLKEYQKRTNGGNQ
jgi:hypothetical protein